MEAFSQSLSSPIVARVEIKQSCVSGFYISPIVPSEMTGVINSNDYINKVVNPLNDTFEFGVIEKLVLILLLLSIAISVGMLLLSILFSIGSGFYSIYLYFRGIKRVKNRNERTRVDYCNLFYGLGLVFHFVFCFFNKMDCLLRMENARLRVNEISNALAPLSLDIKMKGVYNKNNDPAENLIKVNEYYLVMTYDPNSAVNPSSNSVFKGLF